MFLLLNHVLVQGEVPLFPKLFSYFQCNKVNENYFKINLYIICFTE